MSLDSCSILSVSLLRCYMCHTWLPTMQIMVVGPQIFSSLVLQAGLVTATRSHFWPATIKLFQCSEHNFNTDRQGVTVKNIAYVVYNCLGWFVRFTPIKSIWIGVQESESTNLSENSIAKFLGRLIVHISLQTFIKQCI